MDTCVLLFLKVMRAVINRWRLRNRKNNAAEVPASLSDVPAPTTSTPGVKSALVVLAIDVLLELTRLLVDQAQTHCQELEP